MCHECSDETRVSRNCPLPLRSEGIRDVRDPSMNPRCNTLGYDRNGNEHVLFDLKTVETVRNILSMQALMDRVGLDEIDAEIWELSSVIAHERGLAYKHWAEIRSKTTKK